MVLELIWNTRGSGAAEAVTTPFAMWLILWGIIPLRWITFPSGPGLSFVDQAYHWRSFGVALSSSGVLCCLLEASEACFAAVTRHMFARLVPGRFV
ncbi:uncharacterized protein CC84DRAFT_809906 [Paraphaeosphaeria sporulosa]|uniref:Uncharacterized protein n=1 Tax=Paraphaeosphaeria sporulosa TaxID=1460663 RepID=A0A177CDH8_9PLEO|nr:uncharacterized protein CC84DRAFT_809906 [Paraphaeosphaeria sporulosa]OAG04942.1 hypothetical protein CC84DRAFT_809906 [Paraphaeosphaeria sporulosa]